MGQSFEVSSQSSVDNQPTQSSQEVIEPPQQTTGCGADITNASTILIILVIISTFVLLRKKHN